VDLLEDERVRDALYGWQCAADDAQMGRGLDGVHLVLGWHGYVLREVRGKR
jgi:hypothetical protein